MPPIDVTVTQICVCFSAQTLFRSLVFKAFSLNHSILSMFLPSSTMFCSLPLQFENYYRNMSTCGLLTACPGSMSVFLEDRLGHCEQASHAPSNSGCHRKLHPRKFRNFLSSSRPLCPQCQFTCSKTLRSNSVVPNSPGRCTHTHIHAYIRVQGRTHMCTLAAC